MGHNSSVIAKSVASVSHQNGNLRSGFLTAGVVSATGRHRARQPQAAESDQG